MARSIIDLPHLFRHRLGLQIWRETMLLQNPFHGNPHFRTDVVLAPPVNRGAGADGVDQFGGDDA